MNPYKKLNWNVYSAIVAPFLIIIVCFFILLPNASKKGEGFYSLPIYLLIIIASSSLLFWIFRISFMKNKQIKKVTLYIGFLSFIIGFSATIFLLFLSLLKLFFPITLLSTKFEYQTDFTYWLVSLWSIIEGIHHYIYRLLYTNKTSKNFGGAIGIQIYKLKQELHLFQRYSHKCR